MLKKEKLHNEFSYEQIWRAIYKSYAPEIKIDLPVKKFSDVSKVNRAESPLFFPLESLETRLDKFKFRVSSFESLSTYI